MQTSLSSSPLDCRLINVGHQKGKWKIKSARLNVSMSCWLNISVGKHVVISLHAPKKHLKETSVKEKKKSNYNIGDTGIAVKHQFKHNHHNYCSPGVCWSYTVIVLGEKLYLCEYNTFSSDVMHLPIIQQVLALL